MALRARPDPSLPAGRAAIMSDHWYESGVGALWSPYCQMKTAPPPLPVVATRGCRIVLADGRELIDGVSSWWSACHGYNHPHILERVRDQLGVMPHVMFGGLVHEPAATLARRLIAIVPGAMSRVFFSDSGSTAVEVALKIALQYHKNLGRAGRDRFLCFSDGYHGDTLGAMSVSDPEASMHRAFRDVVMKQFVVDLPRDAAEVRALDDLLAEKASRIAAVIIEPLVQGAGGMRFHSAEVLAAVRELARRHGLLFIADEIATGFWRTGGRFACEQAGVAPDIVCLGKALTGGVIGLGATLATDEVFQAFLSADPEFALMHGPTFMANPLACTAANASLDLFETEPRREQARAISAELRAGLEPCRGMPGVVDVRVTGAVGVVQLDPAIDVRALRPRFIERGVWVRPFHDIVYLTPPFVISGAELDRLTESVREVVASAGV